MVSALGKLGFRIKFNVSIAVLIVAVVFSLTLATIAIVLSVSGSAAERTARRLFEDSAVLMRQHINTMLGDALSSTAGASTIPDLEAPITGDGKGHPMISWFRRQLDINPAFYSLYVGKIDGSFIQLIASRGSYGIITAHDAPGATWYILRSVIPRNAGKRTEHWTFYDRSFSVLSSRINTEALYDPRERPWFKLAVDAPGSEQAQLSAPYVFSSLKQPGLTASIRTQRAGAVFAIDLTLQDIQNMVGSQEISPLGGMILLDHENRVLAASPVYKSALGGGLLKPLPDSPGTLGADIRLLPEGRGEFRNGTWLSQKETWFGTSGTGLCLLVIAPLTDFTTDIVAMQWQIFLAGTLMLLLAIPIITLLVRRWSYILSHLASESERLRNMEFIDSPKVSTSILEFQQLADGFNRMKDTLFSRKKELDTSLLKLEKIVDMGIAMSAERDVNRLAEMILSGAKELAHADGGSLYLKDKNDGLQFQIVLNDTLRIIQGGTSGKPVVLPPVPLYAADGSENHHNVVTHAFHTGETVNIADAYNIDDFDFSGTRKFDQKNGYRSISFLTVPLKPRGGDVIGALQLINSHAENGEICSFTPEIQRFVEALAAGAATALYNRDLLEAQKVLFEAMIDLIAGAIDTKSPYTGGHCKRVPELAFMFTEKVQELSEGPLADFTLGPKGSDAWREFRIGAGLHDCGKVTTPEYVVDKATKLETIYNRIHEIRTRFEILYRDEIIKAQEDQIAGRLQDKEEHLRAVLKQLQDDFAFIAESNLGDEFMAEEKVARIKELAGKTWLRHFDDRLGISWEEFKRYPGGRQILPVQEFLLADKIQHIIKRDEDFQTVYAGKEFKLAVPEHLYNHGEIHNLSISRGTLTEEERFKINEHIMQTIVMLEHLPLPESLKRVPEYAGTHHETLKGTGYPRKLTGKDLSVPSRIMAIADIFEALTASDRPYKKTKTLSECVKILHKFKLDNHIDPVLFDIFLSTGVYRDYALRFLKPEQIDEIDITPFLG